MSKTSQSFGRRCAALAALALILLEHAALVRSAPAVPIGAERQLPRVRKLRESDFDAATHRLKLLTNFTRYSAVYPGNPFGYVPTNTVAIREYALAHLLELANELNEKWKLGIPSPITADHVTRLYVLPKTNAINASILILEPENGRGDSPLGSPVSGMERTLGRG